MPTAMPKPEVTELPVAIVAQPLQPLTPTSLGALTEGELLEKINHYYLAAQELYKKSVVNAILAGVLLAQAKETCGHGNFKIWVKEKLPVISYETANRYRKLAVAIRDNAKVARATFDVETILNLPFMDEEEQGKALQKLEKLTDGKKLSQLYFDFEICKKPDPRGGKTVANPDEDEDREPTPEEVRAAAQQEWKTVIGRLSEVHETNTYAHLPKDQRQALLDTLYQIAEEIEKFQK